NDAAPQRLQPVQRGLCRPVHQRHGRKLQLRPGPDRHGKPEIRMVSLLKRFPSMKRAGGMPPVLRFLLVAAALVLAWSIPARAEIVLSDAAGRTVRLVG